MIAVKTENSNHNFGPPKGKEDEIGDLPCQLVDGEWGPGTTVVYSVWEPNEFERKAIAAGQNIRLGVGWIGGFPPVSVGITHEKGIENG